MTKIHIEIDGQTLEVRPGQMVIEAADAAGIPIPRFCYHKKLSVAANCRMCLVDVANAPKSLPACATPVADGMKVSTTSVKAKEAQRAVMEFLLINHPLDCPICDQGGQCELQDVALEYGSSHSRYSEAKRVVKDKNIGPLISTEMTRCIQCTRCVRFGTEIAGVREMGATGRGEFMEIGTYIENSIDSELSGNIIDLCPVGALTSKPFRFKARAWELRAFPSLSMHDCVGSNTHFHTSNNKVMRALPRENETLNEVWLSDRDRFSYLGLHHAERLTKPQIKRDGVWQETDWTTALEYAVEKLKAAVEAHGPQQLGAIASANSTLEEFYLLQKLLRSIGSHNIDHRTRVQDCSQQDYLGAYPHLGISLSDLEHQDAILLIGSHVRKEQPIISHRIRKATRHGATVFSISPAHFDNNFPCEPFVAAHHDMALSLLEVIKALSDNHPTATITLPPELITALSDITPSDDAKKIAMGLQGKSKISVLLGQFALTHPNAHQIYGLSRWLAHLVEATWGEMSFGANSAGGWLAGAVPHRLPMGQSNQEHQGLTAYQMWQQPRKAYLLCNVEPEYDCVSPQLAKAALEQADAVVVLSLFDNPHYREYADVLLPMTPVSEMAGTYVNAFGDWQGFQAAVMPLGESRPAWKVLRVMANIWQLRGFGYESLGEILSEVLAFRQTRPHYADNLISMPLRLAREPKPAHGCIRLAPVPLYAVDNITRRSDALQQTRDNQCAVIKMHSEEARQQKLSAGSFAWVVQQGKRSEQPLPVEIDDNIPMGAAWVAIGIQATHTLGEPFGVIEFIPS